MKHVKKIASLLLALVMVLSMTVTAFAADRDKTTTDTGTIIIKDPAEGQEYTAYKIFDASYNVVENDKGEMVAGSNYSYTIDSKSEWFADVQKYCYSTYSKNSNDFTEGTVPEAPQNGIYTGNGLTLTPNQDKTVYTISYGSSTFSAPLFAQYLNTKKDGKTGIKLGTMDDGRFGKDNLDLGYYLVDTTLGALCALNTTNPTSEITEKNHIPTNKKEVEVSSGNWGSENNTTINKVVNFKSTIAVPNGTENLCFHDTMVEGLTFLYDTNDETVVKKEYPVRITIEPVGASTSPKDLVDGVDYRVVENPAVDAGAKEACTFHVEFTNSFYEKLGSGDNTVVVYYSAKLNSKATIASTGNENESKVSYSEKNKFTKESITTTYTYELPIYKFTKETNADGIVVEKPLDDTHFKLYTRTETGVYDTLVNLVLADSGVGKGEKGADAQAVYRVATDEEINDGTTIVEEIVTNGSGKFKIVGLALGTYELVETQPHNGYNALRGPVRITIRKNVQTKQIEYSTDEGQVSNVEIKIENNTGNELPSTGGMGTTIFYVVGSILLAGAAILLITKKRMGAAR